MAVVEDHRPMQFILFLHSQSAKIYVVPIHKSIKFFDFLLSFYVLKVLPNFVHYTLTEGTTFRLQLELSFVLYVGLIYF